MTAIFAVVALLVALNMLFRGKGAKIMDEFPNSVRQARFGLHRRPDLVDDGHWRRHAQRADSHRLRLRDPARRGDGSGHRLPDRHPGHHRLCHRRISRRRTCSYGSIGYVNLIAFISLVPLTALFAPVAPASPTLFRECAALPFARPSRPLFVTSPACSGTCWADIALPGGRLVPAAGFMLEPLGRVGSRAAAVRVLFSAFFWQTNASRPSVSCRATPARSAYPVSLTQSNYYAENELAAYVGLSIRR